MTLMAGQHRYPAKTIYPDPDEITAAEERLGVRRVSSYLRACLRWLRSEPDAALAAVADYWPPERPTGRPPRTPGHGLPDDEPHASPQVHIPPAEPDTLNDDVATPGAGK